jgi:hypothetical protein
VAEVTRRGRPTIRRSRADPRWLANLRKRRYGARRPLILVGTAGRMWRQRQRMRRSYPWAPSFLPVPLLALFARWLRALRLIGADYAPAHK